MRGYLLESCMKNKDLTKMYNMGHFKKSTSSIDFYIMAVVFSMIWTGMLLY